MPADTIPWEAQAEQLLQCRLGEGFIGLRPPAQVEAHVEQLVRRLDLGPGSRVLVLGCGPGMYSNRLGAHGCEVTGIDIAEPVLDHARREADAADLPCTYERRSMLELDFEAEFDAAVLTNSIINHLDADDLVTLLAGVRRALVAGGRFACEVLLRTDALAQGGPAHGLRPARVAVVRRAARVARAQPVVPGQRRARGSPHHRPRAGRDPRVLVALRPVRANAV